MHFSEAERQLLASLRRAELEGRVRDRAALEGQGACYWIFREDWSGAFASLRARGLLDGSDDEYRLSEAGRPWGEICRRERPDLYWYYYQLFYPAASASPTHSRFCERVYGRDLCQEVLADMAAIGELLACLDPKPGQQFLDLGCGAGGRSAYIAERSGVRVTGLDNSPAAIAEAKSRTAGRDGRVDFQQADMNALDLPGATYDGALCIDSLYFVDDIPATLAQVVHAIKPAGQLAIFFQHSIGPDEPIEALAADETCLARAFGELGLTFEAHDQAASMRAFWHRVRDTANDLRSDFEADGCGFIADNCIREAEDLLPVIAAGRMTWQLYHVCL